MMPESSRPTISASVISAGSRKHGIHRQAHRQLPAFAVVDRAALRADFEYALLLMLGFCEVFAIAEELEITQARQHRHHPNHRQDPNNQPAETRVALLHGSEAYPTGNIVRRAQDSPARARLRGPSFISADQGLGI